jgi:hypothetical protein
MTPVEVKALIEKAMPYLLVAVSALASGGAVKLWDQAQVDRMEAMLVAETERGARIEDTMNRFHGALDACRARPAWDDMPPDYYRGIDEQTSITERASAARRGEADVEPDSTPDNGSR